MPEMRKIRCNLTNSCPLSCLKSTWNEARWPSNSSVSCQGQGAKLTLLIATKKQKRRCRQVSKTQIVLVVSTVLPRKLNQIYKHLWIINKNSLQKTRLSCAKSLRICARGQKERLFRSLMTRKTCLYSLSWGLRPKIATTKLSVRRKAAISFSCSIPTTGTMVMAVSKSRKLPCTMLNLLRARRARGCLKHQPISTASASSASAMY